MILLGSCAVEKNDRFFVILLKDHNLLSFLFLLIVEKINFSNPA